MDSDFITGIFLHGVLAERRIQASCDRVSQAGIAVILLEAVQFVFGSAFAEIVENRLVKRLAEQINPAKLTDKVEVNPVIGLGDDKPVFLHFVLPLFLSGTRTIIG